MLSNPSSQCSLNFHVQGIKLKLSITAFRRYAYRHSRRVRSQPIHLSMMVYLTTKSLASIISCLWRVLTQILCSGRRMKADNCSFPTTHKSTLKHIRSHTICLCIRIYFDDKSQASIIPHLCRFLTQISRSGHQMTAPYHSFSTIYSATLKTHLFTPNLSMYEGLFGDKNSGKYYTSYMIGFCLNSTFRVSNESSLSKLLNDTHFDAQNMLICTKFIDVRCFGLVI